MLKGSQLKVHFYFALVLDTSDKSCFGTLGGEKTQKTDGKKLVFILSYMQAAHNSVLLLFPLKEHVEVVYSID